jgi:hypothetical protein
LDTAWEDGREDATGAGADEECARGLVTRVRCDAVGDGRLDDRLDGWLEPWVAACGAEPAEPPHPTTLSATRPATVVCSRR